MDWTCSPQLPCDLQGRDLEIRPPTDFVAVPMQCMVVVTAQWYGELIAHLAPQRGRLSKFEMVGIPGRSLTDQAGLRGHECEMGLTSSADRLAYGRDHFRCRRLMVACRPVDDRIRGTVRSWFQRRTWNVVRLASVVAIGGVELSEVSIGSQI